jgi:hypothetical protein
MQISRVAVVGFGILAQKLALNSQRPGVVVLIAVAAKQEA